MTPDSPQKDPKAPKTPEKFPGKSSTEEMILAEKKTGSSSESAGSHEQKEKEKQKPEQRQKQDGEESVEERSDGVIFHTEKPGTDRSEAA